MKFIHTYKPDQIGSKAEWHTAKTILMHTPTNTELFMGVLHPSAALFACPFDPKAAANEHVHFITKLRFNDIQVINLKDILLSNTVDAHGGTAKTQDLTELQEFAKKCLQYEQNPMISNEQESYKKHVVDKLHPEILVDIILIRPLIKLKNTDINTGFSASYFTQPLMNLYFLRDQSITTCNGVVISKMNSEQRAYEIDIIKFVYKKLGINPIYEVEGAGRLEGGDFIPGGDIDFIGQGLRTNKEAIDQLFKHNVFCGKYVVVVKDSWKDQDQMHLDTYFNIISHKKAVLVANRIGLSYDDKMSLHADVYVKTNATYNMTEKDLDFVDFLEKRLHYKIIPVPSEDQLKYGVNFLTIADNKILGVDGVSEQYKASLKEAGVDAEWMDFSNLTCGYGAAHCKTQVLYNANSG